MRYHEIASGFRLPVDGEEQEILSKAEEGVTERDLDDREAEVARKMTSRGLLKRRKRDGEITYVASSVKDIWSDRR